MKLATVTIAILSVFVFLVSGSVARPVLAQQAELVVADFDTGDKPNNVGGDFGSWDKDPNDTTQGCKMTFEQADALGDAAGYSIRLDYDVDTRLHPLKRLLVQT